jgi:sialate O-acetylesterase
VTVRDVLVGDVWILGGQSNMQGCGLFPKKRLLPDSQVRAFYMDDRWAVAKDPVHNMWDCVDAVHVDLKGGLRTPKPDPGWGVCPGPAFGNEMRRHTGVPQGMIACGHGGTTMTQWDPKRKAEGGKSLYGAMIRRVAKNGGRVAGLLWYQGCSDTGPEAARLYTPRMKAFVAAVRRDCGDKALPVAIVQIGRVIGSSDEGAADWNWVQDQQRRLAGTIRNLATVPVIDLPLDDNIHISGASQYALGVRLAQAMRVLREGRQAGLPPIAFKQARLETVRGLGVVVVEFANVTGRLCSGSRPNGFVIINEKSSVNHFDIQIDGSRVRIRSTLTVEALNGCALRYGYGPTPYCNIMDEAGRAVPVFGPIRLSAAGVVRG